MTLSQSTCFPDDLQDISFSYNCAPTIYDIPSSGEYVIDGTYSVKDKCASLPETFVAYDTSVCLPYTNESYYHFGCSHTGPTVNIYDDSLCLFKNSSISLNDSCSSLIYDNLLLGYKSYSCYATNSSMFQYDDDVVPIYSYTPTIEPTVSPTSILHNYAYLSLFDGSGCNGSAYVYVGYESGVCVPIKSFSGEYTSSNYTCVGE